MTQGRENPGSPRPPGAGQGPIVLDGDRVRRGTDRWSPAGSGACGKVDDDRRSSRVGVPRRVGLGCLGEDTGV